jgi:2-dehydro-3-deoxygluconokinase
MSEVMLFGEPMAMFTAEVEGPLEEIELFRRSLAGAEVNVCTGLTRLGHKVSYITKLGKEPLGKYVKNFLDKEGIGTEFITFDSVYNTANMIKSKVSTGDPVTAYYRRGSAFSHMSSEDIDNIDFDGVKLVHVTGIPPALSLSCREATYRLIERAKEHGAFLTFDPNLRPALWESQEVMVQVINDLASKCDLILPGVSEGLLLTGSDNPEEIADFYQGLGINEVIIKLGSEGAYVRNGSTSFIQPGFTVEKIVDTVGAGDGFAVGVISGRLEGLSLKDSIIQANAIGSIQVTFVSDNEGLPTRNELNKYLETFI